MITVFCTVPRLFPVISIVNYLNCTLIAGVKSSIHGNKVFNCNQTENRLQSATVGKKKGQKKDKKRTNSENNGCLKTSEEHSLF